MSGVELSITPALASVTIEDLQPATRAQRVQPRPHRVVDPESDLRPAGEAQVQPQAAEHAAQPAPPPLANPKKARGGRKTKAGTTVQNTGGAAVEAGAPSLAMRV
ncbi:hypothetical protein C8Q70DRAFT_1059840 [Cubamyces menziesii]|nr:hypothetical protein C8Q70DRAFT_1059840 [Cubamyces menziesii]